VTDEILAERRVRAAELALEAARRRVAEAEDEIGALRAQVADLEEKVLAAAARAGAEPARLKGELEAERRVRRLSEQALWAERERSRSLEAELRRRRGRGRESAVERQLATAERRARELEAELELVRHRAAEFEQQVRRAVDAAWAWLGETGERVSASLLELERLRATQAAPAAPATETSALTEPPAAATTDEVIPQRFDEALSRLRASIEPGSGTAD
jgi:predicted  nucleic acid-binding Zn-ribbon protein